MAESPSTFQIDNDSDLEAAVRSATGYHDEVDELTPTNLTAHIDDAKRDVYIETDSTDWYDDLALGQALKAHTCIIAKVAVENYSVSSYSFGDITIAAPDASPEDSLQLQQWAQQAAEALEESDANDDATATGLSNTSAYIG
jgi:hypothetical protein